MMDGFKNSTKTRYFSRPTDGFGYSKGGEVVSRNDMRDGQGPMNAPVVPAKYAKGGKVTSPKGVAKVGKVMGEFGKGELHSGSAKGPVVKNPKQAIAIALSEGRKATKKACGGRVGYKFGGDVKDPRSAVRPSETDPRSVVRPSEMNDPNMKESTSARPRFVDAPVLVRRMPADRLEQQEPMPKAVTVKRTEVTAVPNKTYRGRAGDIATGPRTDVESPVRSTELDKMLRTLPSQRGEMRSRGFNVRDIIPDVIEPTLERAGILSRKKGGLAAMPKKAVKGKKC